MSKKIETDLLARGASYAQRLLEGIDQVLLASMGIGYGPKYITQEVRKLIAQAWSDGYKTCEREQRG